MFKIKDDNIARKLRCPVCNTVFGFDPQESSVANASVTSVSPFDYSATCTSVPGTDSSVTSLSGRTISEDIADVSPGADLNSRDRRMTASLCRVIAFLLISLGCIAILTLLGTTIILDERQQWAFRLLANMAVATFVELIFLGGIIALYFLWAHLIKAGGIASVWIVCIISTLFSLVCLPMIVVGLILVETDVNDGCTMFCVGTIFLLFNVKLTYHASRVLWFSGHGAASAPDDAGLQDRPVRIFSAVSQRRAIIACATLLLLINLTYGVLAISSLVPAFTVAKPLPQISRDDSPLVTATVPFNPDVFDPAEGLDQNARAAVYDSLKNEWRPSALDYRMLDGVLRERGKVLTGLSPVGWTGGNRAEGKKIVWKLFRGIFESDRWKYDKGDTPFEYSTSYDGSRWACFSLQREMDKLLRLEPTATPLQQQAVFEFLSKLPPLSGNILTLPPVHLASDQSLILAPSQQELRITLDGKVFDITPAHLAMLEAARLQEVINLREAQANQAARRIWTFAPAGLACDAIFGIFLSAWLLDRGLKNARIPTALLRASLGELLLFLAACSWFAIAWFKLGGAIDRLLFNAPFYMFILSICVWRLAQFFGPGILAKSSLALHAGRGDALDEGFLGDEEEDEDRQDYQDGGGH
ncbi:MAG: hypothetical protein WCI73_05020 [Phycisphaerae bacterium]